MLRRAACVLGLACGCAHQEALPLGDLEIAYRAVRSGLRPSASAGNVVFCSAADGLRVNRVESDGAADWADKIDSSHVDEMVKLVLSRDRAMNGARIQVNAVDNAVFLSGPVSSDALAIRAISDALSVAGVVFVNANLSSVESPGPPSVSHAKCY